jgi:Fe2+ or Zn2+ uptake regulation protein
MATSSRKLFHVNFICDTSTLHDVLSVVDGKAYDLKVAAVVQQAVAELPAPADAESKRGDNARIARPLLLTFMRKHAKFTTAELMTSVIPKGAQKASVYPLLAELTNNGFLKRVEAGVYRVKKIPEADAASATRAKGKSGTRKKASSTKGVTKQGKERKRAPHGSGKQLILNALQKAEGAPVAREVIIKAFSKSGASPLSVNKLLTELVQAKTIDRVGPGQYTLAQQSQPQPQTEGEHAAV